MKEAFLTKWLSGLRSVMYLTYLFLPHETYSQCSTFTTSLQLRCYSKMSTVETADLLYCGFSQTMWESDWKLSHTIYCSLAVAQVDFENTKTCQNRTWLYINILHAYGNPKHFATIAVTVYTVSEATLSSAIALSIILKERIIAWNISCDLFFMKCPMESNFLIGQTATGR